MNTTYLLQVEVGHTAPATLDRLEPLEELRCRYRYSYLEPLEELGDERDVLLAHLVVHWCSANVLMLCVCSVHN